MANITEADIINKFREMVSKRYEYTQLKERFDLPDVINESIIAEIKAYFLSSIYPEATKRKELEDAFAGLGAYVKSPRKIWGLLGNMSKALFKFGRQFPTALRAGMSGLDAFLGAKNFEAEMVAKASSMNISAPMSDDDFEKVMAQLPKKDIEDFIADVRQLFKIMTNTTLIEKTVAILDNVAETMRHKSKIYPKEEVDGIMLGKGILEDGYDLFSKYDEATKQLMVETIHKNEMWNSNTVYSKWG